MAESYKPPQSVQNNARKALELRREAPPSRKGLTSVGIARARQLASGQRVSLATAKRMAQFARHLKNYKPGQNTPGTIAVLAWGGPSGIRWARSIVRKAEKGT